MEEVPSRVVVDDNDRSSPAMYGGMGAFPPGSGRLNGTANRVSEHPNNKGRRSRRRHFGAFLLALLLVIMPMSPTGASSLARQQRVEELERQALAQILQSTRQVHYANKNWTVPLPCSYQASRRTKTAHANVIVMESTSTLLAAKALVKTLLTKSTSNTTTLFDLLAWQYLDALLLLPTSPSDNSGNDNLPLLPKYQYWDILQKTSSAKAPYSASPYITDTRLPHWSMFHNNENTTTNFLSSQRVSALPLHASILWDMVATVLSSRVQGNNKYYSSPDFWKRLLAYCDVVYQSHQYIHTVVMKGCPTTAPLLETKARAKGDRPCYNILHPWESLTDASSDLWKTALQPTLSHIQHNDPEWKLPFEQIPHVVRQAYDFPKSTATNHTDDKDNVPDVYRAMIYLLQCWKNVTATSHHTNNGSSSLDDLLWKACPYFAMLDVGYAAVLARADADLLLLGRLLLQQQANGVIHPNGNIQWHDGVRYTREATTSRSRNNKPINTQQKKLPHVRRQSLVEKLVQLQQWQHDNTYLFEHVLWNGTQQTYLSRYFVREQETDLSWLNVPVSNNLVALWKKIITVNGVQDNSNSDEGDDNGQAAKEHAQAMASQLLKHGDTDKGKEQFAFDCGLYPIWSHGGCRQPYNYTAWIQPAVNYLVGTGLTSSVRSYVPDADDDNNAGLELIGQHVTSASLDLILRNMRNNDDNRKSWPEAFSIGFPYDSAVMSAQDICGRTSTTTAAVAFHWAVPDVQATTHINPPPVGRNWVITLITLELFLAFMIGASCFAVSFLLVRRLQFLDLDDGDEDTVILLPNNYQAMASTTGNATPTTSTPNNNMARGPFDSSDPPLRNRQQEHSLLPLDGSLSPGLN